MMYLLDTNIFIEAKNRYYDFDIVPGFWSWLERAHARGHIISIDAVANELLAGNDRLADWVKQHRQLFRPFDGASAQHFPHLTQWSVSKGYKQSAVQEFASSADYLLIAYACEHKHTLVTNEVSDPKARRKVKIPDACAAMGVQTANVFDVLKAKGARFLLAP